MKKKLLTQLSSVKNISVKEELSLGVGQKLILVAFRDRDILLSSSKGELRVVDSIASEEPKWQYEKKLGEREHRYEV